DLCVAVWCDVYCTFGNFFFFSSRRRHTRFSRDWSSDVCSSDLIILGGNAEGLAKRDLVAEGLDPDSEEGRECLAELTAKYQELRSEERRVGKECRSWGAPHD